MHACEGGNVGIVKFLIVYHDCDPACRGWEGRTPLHCSCGSGKLLMLSNLWNSIIKCEPIKCRIGMHGDTPLHQACQGGNIDIARLL